MTDRQQGERADRDGDRRREGRQTEMEIGRREGGPADWDEDRNEGGKVDRLRICYDCSEQKFNEHLRVVLHSKSNAKSKSRILDFPGNFEYLMLS